MCHLQKPIFYTQHFFSKCGIRNSEFGIRNSEFGIENSYRSKKMNHLGHRKNVLILAHIKWPCTCEPKGINLFSLRQNLRLLLSLFESKPHLIIIFHLKTNRQKLEKHHLNGSQTRTLYPSIIIKSGVQGSLNYTLALFW